VAKLLLGILTIGELILGIHRYARREMDDEAARGINKMKDSLTRPGFIELTQDESFFEVSCHRRNFRSYRVPRKHARWLHEPRFK
jgi:hypothetical protein